jgi:transcriptional regulator with XRE-family HTH domain
MTVTKDNRGYSNRIASQNRAADTSNPGVQLGRYCSPREISAQSLARDFGVSKVAIYNWMSGLSVPNSQHARRISQYLKRRHDKD